MKRYIFDNELAHVFGMTEMQLRRICAGFVRGGHGSHKTHAAVVRNLNDAKPEVVNGRRRWAVRRLADVLELSPSALLAAAEGAPPPMPPSTSKKKSSAKKKRKTCRWGEPVTVYPAAVANVTV